MAQSATRMVSFYVDDSVLLARDPVWLQSAFSVLITLFEQVGLKTNMKKTQVMTCVPGKIRESLSKEVYHDSRMGLLSSADRKRLCVNCDICGEKLRASSLQATSKRNTTFTTCSFSIGNLLTWRPLRFVPRSTLPPASTPARCPVALERQLQSTI